LQRELGLSYIFISHDLSVVEAICDEIVVMYGGRKVEEITAATLAAPQHPYTQLLVSSVPKLDPTWLDTLRQDPEQVRAYCQR
jgi:peptide/nickel transport system ATP-binding protein